MEKFLFITNHDSRDIFSFNRGDQFTIFSPQPYSLHGNWKGAITEFTFACVCSPDPPKPVPIIPDNIYVSIDLFDSSYVNGTTRVILRKIPILGERFVHNIYSVPYYFQVLKNNFNTFMVTLFNSDFKKIDLEEAKISFVLHLKQNGKNQAI